MEKLEYIPGDLVMTKTETNNFYQMVLSANFMIFLETRYL